MATVEQDGFDPGADESRAPEVIRAHTADVGEHRERQRRRRLIVLLLVVGLPALYVWLRFLHR